MALTGDEKDLTIAKLAVQVTIFASHVEDLSKALRESETKLAIIEGDPKLPATLRAKHFPNAMPPLATPVTG